LLLLSLLLNKYIPTFAVDSLLISTITDGYSAEKKIIFEAYLIHLCAVIKKKHKKNKTQ
jgi:hypothetical protein